MKILLRPMLEYLSQSEKFDATYTIRNINNLLGKNHRILAELNPSGKIKVSKNKLLEKSYNFTHIQIFIGPKQAITIIFSMNMAILSSTLNNMH
jgi:hypothetical protein